MKVYNKKGLYRGILEILLSIGLLIGFLTIPALNIYKKVVRIFLIIVLFLIGVNSIVRAFSKEDSQEDIKEEQKQRKIPEFKAKSLILNILFVLSLVFTVLSRIAFNKTGLEIFAGMCVMNAFFAVFIIFGNFFARVYYEHKENKKLKNE